jgi:hypothetical protein
MEFIKPKEQVWLLHTQEVRGSSPCAPTISEAYKMQFTAIQVCCFSGRLSPRFFATKPFDYFSLAKLGSSSLRLE